MITIDKRSLLRASRIGAIKGYNRQVAEDVIDKLPEGAVFPILASTPHRHAQGQRRPVHMRVIIAVAPTETWQMDIDMSIYDELKEHAA